MGSTPDSALLTVSLTNFLTIGILVGPPTRTIFVISDIEILASSIAFSIDGLHLWTIECIRSSNFALVSLTSKFLAPEESCAMNGKLISVSITVDNSIFAFSEDSLTLSAAWALLDRSIPSFFLNSSIT